jgi:DNA mismatch repair protein MSH6
VGQHINIAETAETLPVVGLLPPTNPTAEELSAYLEEQRGALKAGGSSLRFFHSAKDRFHLELPEDAAARIPASAGYQLQSKRKGSGRNNPGVWRYTTKESERLVARLAAAEARRDELVTDALRRLFERFDGHRGQWEAVVSCLSTLDCLLSLAAWSTAGDGRGMCRPVVLPLPAVGAGAAAAAAEPFLHLRGARHPTLAAIAETAVFIPNDVSLGHDATTTAAAADSRSGGATAATGGPACVLISGPNMGGKST